MNDSEFINFINTTSTRGGATFNLKTCNVSKQAVAKLQDSKYNALAKMHINANVKQAYYSNEDFAQKLQEVMNALQIAIIA